MSKNAFFHLNNLNDIIDALVRANKYHLCARKESKV